MCRPILEASAQHGSLRGTYASKSKEICLRDCGDKRRGDRLFAVEAEPALTVGAHVLDDRQQRQALFGERVLHARWDLGKSVALDNALILECAQAQRECARTDPRQRALQLTEARASLGQVADEQ